MTLSDLLPPLGYAIGSLGSVALFGVGAEVAVCVLIGCLVGHVCATRAERRSAPRAKPNL